MFALIFMHCIKCRTYIWIRRKEILGADPCYGYVTKRDGRIMIDPVSLQGKFGSPVVGGVEESRDHLDTAHCFDYDVRPLLLI